MPCYNNLHKPVCQSDKNKYKYTYVTHGLQIDLEIDLI